MPRLDIVWHLHRPRKKNDVCIITIIIIIIKVTPRSSQLIDSRSFATQTTKLAKCSLSSL